MSTVHSIPGRTGVRIGPASFIIKWRPAIIGLVLVAIAIALIAAGALDGKIEYGADRVLAVMFGGGDDVERLLIGKRLVRTGLAVFVGAALGIAGAITQSLLRNPLASPDILGVSSGAGLAAVLAMVFPVGFLSQQLAVPLAAAIGALVTCAAILALSVRRSLDPFRLVLVGIAITAVAGAATSWLLLRAELDTTAMATRWLTGSVAGASSEDVTIVAWALAIGATVVILTSRSLGTLRFGQDVARGIGIRPVATQLILAAVVVLLVAAATSVAGPVGFVAFVAPQLAMRLMGTAGPPPLAAGLVGAVVVAGADLITRALPVDLPVGIFTSILGAPVLLFLLFHSVRKVSA